MNDYKERKYLSSTEAAKYLGITVDKLHHYVKKKSIQCFINAGGQMRFDLLELKRVEKTIIKENKNETFTISSENTLIINNTEQKIFVKSSMQMQEVSDESIHLIVTSPPYFNTKMYSKNIKNDDLGNIHDLEEWLEKIGLVWKECFRVLQSGRKIFVNIMNLPIRENGSFRTINLVGKTIDLMENIGFIFKRDIIWEKTNGVRAHFGTYPYPGGILINNMHEFILEFNKPEKKGFNKYAHLNREQKELSKIDKDFWLLLKNSDVWKIKPENSGDGRLHVAPFPYELPYRIIKAYSFVGETVLDPFLGSGTTLIASADLQRNGIGYEIYPENANTSYKRLLNHTSKLFT
jgi:DNA modification methylase